MPTSSSCLNLEDGGYLCQPRSSSITGALTRSKLPRPEIALVTVMGSPTCTLLGFASVVIVKFPIAPEKLGGALDGSGFTSSATGLLLTVNFSSWPNLLVGSAKNGSLNKSSKSRKSGGKRGRMLRWPCGNGTTTTVFACAGPMSNLPARVAAMAVLNV